MSKSKPARFLKSTVGGIIPGLADTPKVPEYKPPPVVEAPVVESDPQIEETISADEEKKRKTQKGRAATILSGGTGSILGDDGIATRKLTGG